MRDLKSKAYRRIFGLFCGVCFLGFSLGLSYAQEGLSARERLRIHREKKEQERELKAAIEKKKQEEDLKAKIAEVKKNADQAQPEQPFQEVPQKEGENMQETSVVSPLNRRTEDQRRKLHETNRTGHEKYGGEVVDPDTVSAFKLKPFGVKSSLQQKRPEIYDTDLKKFGSQKKFKRNKDRHQY